MPSPSLQELALNFLDGGVWEQAARWYVERPTNTVGDDLAVSLAAVPCESHVVVGAVGVGKSTELHRAAARLREREPDLLVALEDADMLGDGLLTLDHERLATRVVEALARAIQGRGIKLPEVQSRLVERVIARERRARQEGDMALEPVRPEPLRELNELAGHLAEKQVRAVVILDSLDRVRPPSEYVAYVAEQVRAVSRAGVGLVLTASLEMRYQHWREQLQHFDRVRVLRHLNTESEPEGAFLRAVIGRRDAGEAITPDARARLVSASGGHMRSLIQLIRSAIEAADARGEPSVMRADADESARRLGDDLAGELLPNQVDALHAVRRGKIPVELEETLVNLLRDARVFNGSMATYRLHPLLDERLAEAER